MFRVSETAYGPAVLAGEGVKSLARRRNVKDAIDRLADPQIRSIHNRTEQAMPDSAGND
jgi:hypothetical protein